MTRSKTLRWTLSLALASLPAMASAAGVDVELDKRHGADDPAGHARQEPQPRHARGRGHRADDPAGHKRHGADDPSGEDGGGQGEPGDDNGNHPEPGDDNGGGSGHHGGDDGGSSGNGGSGARSRAGVFKLEPRGVVVRESSGLARVRIERSRGERGAVSVKVTVAGVSATAGSDFEAVSGVVSWPAGVGGVKIFTVPIKNDSAAEPTEKVQLTLSEPTGGALVDPARGKATLTILDDDGAKACVADFETLCLADGRFQVSAAWRSAAGELGQGRAFAASGEQGAFALSADRPALKVRVVDACAAAGSYWLALESDSDDDFSVLVTDTQTGLVKELVNTAGRPTDAVWDTSTFDCDGEG